MKVWSVTPLPTAAMLWQSGAGAWSLTVVAKATFSIEPGESPLAANPEPIHDDDLYDVRGQLWAPSDLVPFKPRADVMLVGAAYSPRAIDVVIARLIVGAMEKAIEVRTNHYFDPDGQLVEGQHWTSMPLGWDHAAGGQDSTNPAGIAPDVSDRNGRNPLPNQLVPGTKILAPGEYLEPTAFAPVPPAWALRSRFAGATPVHPVLWYEDALPADLHPAFFNAAPPDQQPEFLAEDPRVILEHLSPLASRVTTTLAPVRVAVYLEGRATGSYALRPDTLWIDTEQQLCTVTYRATVALGPADAATVATIVSDPPTPGAEPTPVALYGGDASAILDPPTNDELPSGAKPPPSPLSPIQRRATSPALFATDGLPFAAAPPPAWPDRESAPPASPPVRDQGLPFQRSASPTRPIEPRPSKAATPFEHQPPLLAPPLAPPPPPGPPLAPLPPPAPALIPPPSPPPTTPPPPPRPMDPSPPLGPPPSPPRVRPVEPRNGPAIPPPAPSQPSAGGGQPWAFQPQPEPPKRVVHEARAALEGVASASNAAAGPGEAGGSARKRPAGQPIERPRVTSTDVVDLVWFEESLPLRIRRQDSWSDAVRDEVRLNDWVTVDETDKGAKDDQRRFVTRALGRVPPTEPTMLSRLLSESVDEEGFIDRRLVVIAGELALQFDGVEILKSTVEMASQLGMSEKLKEALEGGKEIAQAQRVSTPLVDNLLSRIRREFAQANRSLPNDYLESTVHRTMLEERKYQRRQVLGEAHLLGLLLTGGSTQTPTYLPEHLGAQIPVLARFKVRLVAEPHPAQHPGDGEGATLRVLALGRVIGARNRSV